MADDIKKPADEFLTIEETCLFIRQNYDRTMERLKLWSYCTRGWFEVVEYPGGNPRIRRSSIVEAYENPPPSKKYPYRGTRLIDPVAEVPEPLETAVEAE